MPLRYVTPHHQPQEYFVFLDPYDDAWTPVSAAGGSAYVHTYGYTYVQQCTVHTAQYLDFADVLIIIVHALSRGTHYMEILSTRGNSART
jgi:hypothetical protein